MKRTFFFFVIVFLVVATVSYLFYLVVDAIYSMYKDWRLGKELDELEQWAQQKKAAESHDQSTTS